MELYFITGNKNKFAEASAIIPELRRVEMELDEIQEIDARKVIEHKLREAIEQKETSFIVEDVSLYLDCLNGLPGPLIKWFLKTVGVNGLYDICKRYDSYKAKAVSLIGHTDGEKIEFFEGKLEGKIVGATGKNGFGWDPIFKPNSFNKTYAEMTSSEKNQISHRRKALDKLKKYLEGK